MPQTEAIIDYLEKYKYGKAPYVTHVAFGELVAFENVTVNPPNSTISWQGLVLQDSPP